MDESHNELALENGSAWARKDAAQAQAAATWAHQTSDAMVDSVTKVYSAVADADKANAAALQQLQNQVIALNQHYMTQAAQAEQTKTAAEGAANAQLAQNGQSPLPQMPVAPVSREYVGPSAAPVNFDDILKMGAQGLASDGFTATGGGDPAAGMFTWNPNYSEGRISGDLGAVTGYLKDVGNGSKKDSDYQTGTLSGSLAFRDERKVDRLAPAGHLKGTPMNHLQLDLLRPGQPVKYQKYDYEFDIMDDGSGTAEQQNAIQKSTPVISSQSDTGTAGNAGFSTPPNQIRERVRFEQLPSAQQTAINQALVSLLSKKGYNGQSLGASANSPTCLQELLAALEKANSIPEGHTILRNTTMTRLEWDMLANQMAAASAAQQPSAYVYDNQGLPTGITGQSAAQILSHLPPDAQAKMKMYFANDMKGMMNAGMMDRGSQALSSEDPPMLQSMGNWFLKRKYLLATPINPFGTLLFLASDTTDDDLSMMAWGVTEDPAGMAKAVGDGAVISGKIAVNGTATVVTQTVTLGIYDDQIYLIPVSEDEMPYYQNGSVYFQAGGHLLTAVAPGGLLTKFGHLPRAATFAKGLAIFDQLGNAVQTSQGIYDMTQKGVNFSNLMSVGFGGLGLGGQIGAVWKAKVGRVEDVFASISGAFPKNARVMYSSGPARKKGIIDDFTTFSESEAQQKLIDLAKAENIRTVRIRVISETSDKIKSSANAAFAIEDSRPIIFVRNSEWQEVVGRFRHELVHFDQWFYHRKWYNWGTTNFIPASSVVRFLLEVPAHGKHSEFSSKYAGALKSVLVQPGQWIPDLGYATLAVAGLTWYFWPRETQK